VVSFHAVPFRGGLHTIIEWHDLESYTPRSLADHIAQSLRYSLKEHGRDESQGK
jgi:hypothetical protein